MRIATSTPFSRLTTVAATFLLPAALAQGLFTNQTSIGNSTGAALFDPTSATYRLTGKGANIWGQADDFHYLWKQASGDIVLQADNQFEGPGTNPHRKVVLMVRQSLDANSPYADVAIHGDGMISLQYRSAAGQATRELRSTATAAGATFRLERHGDQFNMVITKPGANPAQPPNLVTVPMKDPVYVGIGISSHEAAVEETSNIKNLQLEVTPRTHIRSILSIYDLKTRKTEEIYTAERVFEAPNWSPDGTYLLINMGGDLYRIPPKSGATPAKLPLSMKVAANNDHGLTRDGKILAISGRGEGTGSQVFLANSDGTATRLVAKMVPSYFHGFSPDGKWFSYAADRGGNFDLYRMPTNGGPDTAEERLTNHAAYDDGPDYSPDGKWIYLNSERTGHMQIWRIPATGAGKDDSAAEQIVKSEMSDWFPHPSPDSKWIVMISFAPGTVGHPPNRDVELRLMPMPKGKPKAQVQPKTIVKLFGGQGTINVNSWSPDSKRFAFVRNERVPDAK